MKALQPFVRGIARFFADPSGHMGQPVGATAWRTLAIICLLFPSMTVDTPAQANWRLLSLPPPVNSPGVEVYKMAFDIQSPNTMYAASGGLYRSTDGGSTWAAIESSPTWDVAVDPFDSRVLYAGRGGDVYKSTDSGISWSKIFAHQHQGSRLVVDPTDSKRLFTKSMHGGNLQRSVDGGATWAITSVEAGGTQSDIVIHPKDHNVIYVAAGSGWKSTDGGDTWAPFAESLVAPGDPGRIDGLAVDPTNPDIVYIGLNNGPTGLHKSSDGGKTFAEISFFRSEFLNVFAIAVDSGDPRVIYAGAAKPGAFWAERAKDVYKTSDGGMTWAPTGLTSDYAGRLYIDPSTGRVYASTPAGLFVYEPGAPSTAPDISVTPADIRFGEALVGQPSSRTLSIANRGNADLSVTNITSSDGQVVVSPISFTVASGESLGVAVTFTPLSEGAKSGVLNIMSNDPDERTKSVSFSGQGVSPATAAIHVAPDALHFESVVPGAAETLTLKITDAGRDTLRVSEIAFAESWLQVSPAPPYTILPGGSQQVQVTLLAAPSADRETGLTLRSNDPNRPEVSVPVRITVLVRPQIEVSPASLPLGDVTVGGSRDSAFTVRNGGNALLTGSVRSRNEAFTVFPDTFAVEPGGAKQIRVSFSPQAVGFLGSILEITSNAGGKTLEVTARGVTGGTQPPGPGGDPSISVFPAIINFGEASIGQSKSLSISVSNAGGGTLRVLNIVASSGDFAVSETGFSLTAGRDKTLTITFLPSVAGTVNETLDIPSNDPNKPLVQVPLRATVRAGSGGAPRIVAGINVLEFGEVGATGLAELNLPIRNEGSATLHISNVVSKDLQVAVVPRTLSIPPQAAHILTVQFRPRPGRARSGEIVINSDDPDQPALRIPWEAAVGIVEQALSVASSTPGAGDVGVSQETELTVRFSEPLLISGRFVAVDAQLVPQAASGPLLDRFTLADGEKEIRFQVTLKPDAFYRLVVSGATGRSGARLEDAFEIGFSTGASAVALGSISGSVSFVDGRAFEGSVVLFDSGGELLGREIIEEDGTYALLNLPSGDYQVFADVFAEGAGSVSGAYDVDGDGQPDAVPVSSGQNVQGVDLLLSAPEPEPSDTTAVPPVNEGASVGLDLDGASGDQAKTASTGVQADDEILLSVYASDAVDVMAYTVTLAYDSTQVAFKRADENGSDDEKNLLSSAGGSALFIRTPPEDGKVGMAGAILGATSEVTPSGDGLLGVFRFVAQADFSEATFRVAELVLQSGDAQDTVRASVEATVSAGGSQPPAGPGEEVPGPILVDLDPASGNQNLKTKTGVKAGDIITLQLFGDEFPEVTGFGLNVAFDKAVLSYVEKSFSSEDFISGATSLATDKGGVIEASAASFTGATGSGDGLLGKLDFVVGDAFADSTYLAVTTVGFSLTDGTLKDVVMNVVARLQAGGESGLPGDFDGDGEVGFKDFLKFAQAFGKADARYDLTGDGEVGFRDFLIFAQNFGKRAKPSAKPVGALPVGAGVNCGATVGLASISHGTPDRLEVAVRLTDAVDVQGYSLRVGYDASALAFVEALGRAGSMFATAPGPRAAALTVSSAPGEVLLSDVLLPDAAIRGAGELVRLAFRVLGGGSVGCVEVSEALVSDGSGAIDALPGVRLADLQALPAAFSLDQNHPNPFNPATQIAYALPVAGEVRLTVYNLLGQPVRVLVDGRREAGRYRATWDGRDAFGRPVTSGIYLYRLEAESYAAVRKMLLLK